MRKVLIVEDDKFISAIFSFFIKDMGHQLVGRCQTGIEAVELCKTDKPDVVLMDIHLEGAIDGIQTAEQIQRDFDVPVIFISSDTSNDVVERAIVANSYGYLVKPVLKKELAISIDLAYYKHKASVELKRREQKFRSFLSQMPMPIVIIVDGKIQYLNINALDLFKSHYLEDLIGLTFLSFVDKDYKDSFEKYLCNVDSGATGTGLELNLKIHQNKGVFVSLVAAPIEFAGKNALQLLIKDNSRLVSLQNTVNTLRNAVFNSNHASVVFNDKLEPVSCNQPFQKMAVIDDVEFDSSSVASFMNINAEDIRNQIKMGEKYFRSNVTVKGTNRPVDIYICGEKNLDDFEIIMNFIS